jgi:hypothetical protein
MNDEIRRLVIALFNENLHKNNICIHMHDVDFDGKHIEFDNEIVWHVDRQGGEYNPVANSISTAEPSSGCVCNLLDKAEELYARGVTTMRCRDTWVIDENSGDFE